LNAIIGFSEMMQRQLLGPIGTEKYLDYIKGIRESGEHLLDLISDILDMSKIEAGKYELVTEQVNISKVIQLSVHMMEGRALDNTIKLETILESEDITITADRRAIMQVLLNLLSNAVKFTKENGAVSVSCKKVSKGVEIVVKDNGIGIPAMKLNSITNPFEQVSNQYTRDHDGSGLGLAITKELVELHGGQMSIESKVDVGTSVKITLPA
ncbi:MAG: sensor histidine kinase, partial [Bdellovibrionales bacterium]